LSTHTVWPFILGLNRNNPVVEALLRSLPGYSSAKTIRITDTQDIVPEVTADISPVNAASILLSFVCFLQDMKNNRIHAKARRKIPEMSAILTFMMEGF
jgi:hypothetical protein